MWSWIMVSGVCGEDKIVILNRVVKSDSLRR